MTDKQIIIDGVDVSGCRYLFDDTLYKRSKTSCSITLKDCKYLGNNCYYKQLKRKEQECEELKKTVEDLLHKPEIQDKILWKIDNEALLGSKDAWIYKLEQTLTEIKEIAEDFYLDGEYVKVKYLAQEILDKINEVENEKV